MGGNSSSVRNAKNNDSLCPTDQKDPGSLYFSDLISYARTCEQDPDLKSFDSMLCQRTNQAMKSLLSVPENRARSFDVLVKVLDWLLDMNQEVLGFMVASKEDVRNNSGFSSLVNLYFESSMRTLDVCNAMENCFKQVELNKLIFQFAIKVYNKDTESEISETLKKITWADDAFNAALKQLASMYNKQVHLLEELRKIKKFHKKELKSVEKCRRAWNAVFMETFVSVLIIESVATPIPVMAAVARTLESFTGTTGTWSIGLWIMYENVVKGQSDTVTSILMNEKSFVRFTYMDAIKKLIDILDSRVNSIRSMAETDEDGAVKLAMDKIMELFDAFSDDTEKVKHHADRFYRDVLMARAVVRNHKMSLDLQRNQIGCSMLSV